MKTYVNKNILRKAGTQFFLPIILVLFGTGCSLSVKVLKGNYPEKPSEIISEQNYDEVWSNTIDFFATNGLSIKILDKNSGLIVSEKTSFISHYSYENDDGTLKNPNAWIAVERIYYAGGYSPIHPESISGEWSIRIKRSQEEKTIINVNLANIQAYAYIGTATNSEKVDFKVKTTGIFEKLVSDIVK